MAGIDGMLGEDNPKKPFGPFTGVFSSRNLVCVFCDNGYYHKVGGGVLQGIS